MQYSSTVIDFGRAVFSSASYSQTASELGGGRMSLGAETTMRSSALTAPSSDVAVMPQLCQTTVMSCFSGMPSKEPWRAPISRTPPLRLTRAVADAPER